MPEEMGSAGELAALCAGRLPLAQRGSAGHLRRAPGQSRGSGRGRGRALGAPAHQGAWPESNRRGWKSPPAPSWKPATLGSRCGGFPHEERSSDSLSSLLLRGTSECSRNRPARCGFVREAAVRRRLALLLRAIRESLGGPVRRARMLRPRPIHSRRRTLAPFWCAGTNQPYRRPPWTRFWFW
jgi:hypothetical protein